MCFCTAGMTFFIQLVQFHAIGAFDFFHTKHFCMRIGGGASFVSGGLANELAISVWNQHGIAGVLETRNT